MRMLILSGFFRFFLRFFWFLRGYVLVAFKVIEVVMQLVTSNHLEEPCPLQKTTASVIVIQDDLYIGGVP